MTAFRNDPRVRWVNQYHAAIVLNGDIYDVSADKATKWIVTLGIGSRTMREANLRTQADADAFAARTWWGPYRSADDAINAVLAGRLRRKRR
jgi:hypothetical protein